MISDQFLGQVLALVIAAATLWTVNIHFALALSTWCIIYIGVTLLAAPHAWISLSNIPNDVRQS